MDAPQTRLTVCMDVLGTCFTLEPVIEALDELMGDELRRAGSGARMVIMDWFHSAQRDYTYHSMTAPPPPPIAQILKSTLPRSLLYALNKRPSLSGEISLPDLSRVYSRLSHLTPAPGLQEGLHLLKSQSPPAGVVMITNGARETTQGYVDQAGLGAYVDAVQSCDQVGKSKPFADVYTTALELCDKVERKAQSLGGMKGKDESERWFVAAHMWDLHAARTHGFKTGYILAEQPPFNGEGREGEDTVKFWNLYGGRPDVVGSTIKDVFGAILQRK